MITNDTIVNPNEATTDDLLLVHTKRYLSSLNWSIQVARVLEVPPIALLPNFIVQWRVLKPLRYQTGGSILAGKLALERGWSINVGGGFHHCSSDRGGGFCAYADLTLLIMNLFNYYSDRIKKILIVDLDAHQGNGHEDILQDDPLGNLDITPEGVIIRDEIVFSKCIRERNIPIVMCTSGGYQRTNARVIADSILNLFTKKLISC
ncbi:unnamed protein product [Rotaria sp. Silwood2]|nr:unnamed protein product [Rotaria sp. Silwood2]